MSISDFAENKPKGVTTWDPTEQSTTPTSTDQSVTAPTVESTTTESTTTTENPTIQAPIISGDPQEQVNSIADAIMAKIQPIGQRSCFKMMLYGEPGTIKSSIVATAPNNLIIDNEDGLISAKGSPFGIADNVRSFPFTDFDELSNLIGLLMNHYEPLEQYKVLSLDTFSEMHKIGLANVLTREHLNRPNSVNAYKAETEHHSENNEFILRVLRALKNLDRDLIITAHSRTVEPKSKPAKTYADFSESLSNRIMAMMDVVGYMSWMDDGNGNTIPVMRTVSDGTIHCKSRIPLPPLIPNPTYPMIRAAWEESKNK